MVSFGASNTDNLPHFNVEDTEVHSTLKETLAILQNNEIYEKFKVHASKLCEQDTFGTDSFFVTVFDSTVYSHSMPKLASS